MRCWFLVRPERQARRSAGRPRHAIPGPHLVSVFALFFLLWVCEFLFPPLVDGGAISGGRAWSTPSTLAEHRPAQVAMAPPHNNAGCLPWLPRLGAAANAANGPARRPASTPAPTNADSVNARCSVSKRQRSQQPETERLIRLGLPTREPQIPRCLQTGQLLGAPGMFHQVEARLRAQGGPLLGANIALGPWRAVLAVAEHVQVTE